MANFLEKTYASVNPVGMFFKSQNDAANAAQDAAMEQRDAADRYAAQVQKNKADAVGLVMTPSALAAQDIALHGQEANVRRQEALVASLDPNIIEAGKQTSQILQGKSAPVLGQIQNQRALQKQQMLDQLRTQMGPGAESSTAGQQAIQQFDQQTASMMNDVQQQYLQQVNGIALGGAQTLGQTLNQVHSTLTGILANGPQAEAARIMQGYAGAESAAAQGQIQTAGADKVGSVIHGQQMMSLGQSVIQLGAATAGGAKMAAAKAGAQVAETATQPQQQPQQNYTIGMSALPDVSQQSTLGNSVTSPPTMRTSATNFRDPNSGYFPGGSAGGFGVDSRQRLIDSFGTPNYAGGH